MTYETDAEGSSPAAVAVLVFIIVDRINPVQQNAAMCTYQPAQAPAHPAQPILNPSLDPLCYTFCVCGQLLHTKRAPPFIDFYPMFVFSFDVDLFASRQKAR